MSTDSVTSPPLEQTLTSLKAQHPDRALRIDGLLYVSASTYLAGIFWPMLTIQKKIIGIPLGGNSVSLASGLIDLIAKGDVALFALIFVFSIAFPVGKLAVLFRLWLHPFSPSRAHALAHRLAVFGKWSMLDVLVVGMLVAIVKIRGMVEVEVHMGIYFFALSVILSMLVTAAITRMLDSLSSSASPAGL